MRSRSDEPEPLNWQESNRKTALWSWGLGAPILAVGLWLLVDMGAERGRTFRGIPLGASEEEVLAVFGNPTEEVRLPGSQALVCVPVEVEAWVPARYLLWSGKGDHTNYAVGLDRSGKVIRKCATRKEVLGRSVKVLEASESPRSSGLGSEGPPDR